VASYCGSFLTGLNCLRSLKLNRLIGLETSTFSKGFLASNSAYFSDLNGVRQFVSSDLQFINSNWMSFSTSVTNCFFTWGFFGGNLLNDYFIPSLLAEEVLRSIRSWFDWGCIVLKYLASRQFMSTLSKCSGDGGGCSHSVCGIFFKILEVSCLIRAILGRCG